MKLQGIRRLTPTVLLFVFALPLAFILDVRSSGAQERQKRDRLSGVTRAAATAAVKARNDAARDATIKDAEILAADLCIYAQDYDDTFPPQDTNLRELVRPYDSVSSDVQFARFFAARPGTPEPNNPKNPVFRYTFKGGHVDVAKNGSATVLGYKRGPGGRAVIYADGHCEWKADTRADTP